jgi:superfamily I DNA and/or RNA helicase
MKTITSADKGKRYFVDGKRSLEVELVDIKSEGYAEVRFEKGNIVTISTKRLTEITEIPQLERIEDDERKVLLEYPQKAVRLEVEIFDAEKGETKILYLVDDDAVKWNDWMRELCFKAEKLGMNPPWLTLEWKEK